MSLAFKWFYCFLFAFTHTFVKIIYLLIQFYCILATADLKLPAWSELEKRIQNQTFSVSQPFTFPVEPVELDLEEIDKLVRKTSLSS